VYGPDDPQRWAGLSQEDEIIDWLHDCYFAAVAGDSPAFEAWPSQGERCLHEYILALWGKLFLACKYSVITVPPCLVLFFGHE
jgi:hypothetical protein